MLGTPMKAPSHPDAVAPERVHALESNGVRLCLHEWGDPDDPPVVLTHGMFDHSRGFDLLAPRLADHYRLIAVDARGHGDSEWCDAYAWDLDVLDIVNVLRWIGRPAHLVGHSKGGGQMMNAACMAPEQVRQVVNLDGFGPPDEGFFQRPGGPDLSRLSIAERCTHYLDRRRLAAKREAWRPYASLEELVSRRRQQNPGLAEPWLSYFVYHAAREDPDGWRWKADPQHASGGFGPFRPDWIAPAWEALRAPVLAVIGSEPDSWGPLPEDLLSARLSHVPRLERATVSGAGHFIHMQRPAATAELILGFLER